MSAQLNRVMSGPRRHVRYAYLIEAWPEGAHLDHLDAFEQAPDEIVIAVLNRELETMRQVLDEERLERDAAVAERDRLRDAIRLVLDSAGLVAVGQLAMAVAS